MISVEEARSTILSKTERLETEDMELKSGDTVTVQLMEPITETITG